jgi:hypothetical protein
MDEVALTDYLKLVPAVRGRRTGICGHHTIRKPMCCMSISRNRATPRTVNSTTTTSLFGTKATRWWV